MSDPKVDSNESEDPQVVNLTNTGTETIKADLVRMHQSGANNIFADEIGMKESRAVGMKAHTVSAPRLKAHHICGGLSHYFARGARSESPKQCVLTLALHTVDQRFSIIRRGDT